jgi:hypothetical protein
MKTIIILLASLAIGSLKTNADSWVQKANFGGTARHGATGFSIGTNGYIGTGHNDTAYYNRHLS